MLQELQSSDESSADRYFLDKWEGYLVAVRGRSQATARRYRYLVERLLQDQGIEATGLTREAIETHLRRLFTAGRGGSVRQGVVVATRSLCEWLLGNQLISSNPAAGLQGPSPYTKDIRPLTVGEVSKLIWGDHPGFLPRGFRDLRNRVLLAVIYMAGLRASEPGKVRLDGIEWDEDSGTFKVLIERAKAAGRDRWVALDPAVSRLLGAYLQARQEVAQRAGIDVPWLFLSDRRKPLSRSAIYKILITRATEVGIERRGRRLSPHILRHSVATHLLQEGWDIKTVQVHLRHASIATTEQYLHTDDRRVRRALQKKSPLRRGRAAAPDLKKALGHLLQELGGLGRGQ